RQRVLVAHQRVASARAALRRLGQGVVVGQAHEPRQERFVLDVEHALAEGIAWELRKWVLVVDVGAGRADRETRVDGRVAGLQLIAAAVLRGVRAAPALRRIVVERVDRPLRYLVAEAAD